jgi:hypothetical protein
MLDNRPILSKPVFQFQRIYLSDLPDVPTLPELRGTDIMEAFLL